MKKRLTNNCPICGNPINRKIYPGWNTCKFCGRTFQADEVVREKAKGAKR